jgi:hypothetical protein
MSVVISNLRLIDIIRILLAACFWSFLAFHFCRYAVQSANLWGSGLTQWLQYYGYYFLPTYAAVLFPVWRVCLAAQKYPAKRSFNATAISCCILLAIIMFCAGTPDIRWLGEQTNDFKFSAWLTAIVAIYVIYIIVEFETMFSIKNKKETEARDKFFQLRDAALAPVIVIVALAWAYAAQKVSIKDEEFLRVQHQLSRDFRTHNLKQLMNQDANLFDIGKISSQIASDINTPLEIIYLADNQGWITPLEVEDERENERVAGLKLSEFRRGIQAYPATALLNEFKSGDMPFLYKSYPMPGLNYVPLVGFIRLNTSQGKLLVMVKTPNLPRDPNFHTAIP